MMNILSYEVSTRRGEGHFEVMNTRGQQLQQVDIVKARLMSFLTDEPARACFAWIWDACADMDSYVQMSLSPQNTDLRREVFGDNWSWLRPSTFEQLLEIHRTSAVGGDPGVNPLSLSTSLTLDAALTNYATLGSRSSSDDPDNVRFRSTIEFPAFLLHVLKVATPGDEEVEGHLDDKRLIKRFDEVFSDDDDDGERVRAFGFELLRCRNLFDSFILKRQFTATNGEDGDWSLQRLIKRVSKGRSAPGYLNTFTNVNTHVEEDGDIDPITSDLLLIQSMLRVTFTSPRTMHWIARILRILVEARPDQASSDRLVEALREYSRSKIKEAYFDDDEPTGFSISRIVFTYLDYLLLAGQSRSEFRFSYRNSIEHFYPQHPDEQQSGSPVSGEHLHMLGNLALVSVGANSKFSNSLPRAKAENYRSTIELQSPKLHLMAAATRAQGWGDEQLNEHHSAMLSLLLRDLGMAPPA